MHPNVSVHIGDVTDFDSLLKASRGVQTVFHLAGVVGYSRKERPLMDQVNVHGTDNVLRAAVDKDAAAVAAGQGVYVAATFV